MKPIVAYSAKKLPFVLEMPIIRKRLSENLDRNYNDKSEFTAFVDSIKPSKTVDGYVGITCCCGKKYDYATKTEIPSSNLICVCGRKLIIYGS